MAQGGNDWLEEWGIETCSDILNPKQVSILLQLLLSHNIYVAILRSRWAFPPVQCSKSNLSLWNKTSSPQLLLFMILPITANYFSSSAELQQFEACHTLNIRCSRLNFLLLWYLSDSVNERCTFLLILFITKLCKWKKLSHTTRSFSSMYSREFSYIHGIIQGSPPTTTACMASGFSL